VDNDDFIDGNKDNNQQEIRQRMMDGILLPPVTLLRRIGGGLLQTGTKNDGGEESEDDNIEDDIWVGRLRVVVDRQQGQPGRKGNYGGRQQDGARHRDDDVLTKEMHRNFVLHNSISL
jgi:hypothetical protein